MEKNWFNESYENVAKELNTDIKIGLSNEEVLARKEKYGVNELKGEKKESLLQKFINQFKDFTIIVLIISAIVSGVVGVMNEGISGIKDSVIIMIIVILNAIIGITQESKAEKSLEALQKLSDHATKVIRNGKMEVIPSRELVPGDIVVLETGDYISADLRIIEAINLKSQEASLTGESVPVEKTSDLIKDENIGIGDRINMLFSSSLVTYGRGTAIVVETGMNTEVGKIAGMIQNTEKQETPLQTRLNKLGKTLGIAALLICVVIFLVGLVQGKPAMEMFMTAVSLAVAAIPEGLVAVSTIVLAIGVQKMVRRNAIVKTLPAVETLGSATVICSDKTGTLTQNKMTVKKVFWNNNLVDVENIEKIDNELNLLLLGNILCNDTKISENGLLIGDPTETALIDVVFKVEEKTNLDVENIIRNLKRVEEVPFDSERKLMTTINEYNGKYIVLTKGGVDELLKRCKGYILNGNYRENIEEYSSVIEINNENMAQKALRVLSFGYKEIDHIPSKEEMKNIESDLIFVGMVGMIDPPREEAKKAVQKCIEAGIKTVMITGDHKVTASAIAKELGILQEGDEVITGLELDKISDEELEKNVRKYSVYARVSPEHKVRIVRAWQKNGEIVAMTGDGVNDSPALKTANIGCAMGVVGTEVAKEAADVILTDDNFATVVSAVEEGRRIYDNILKVIQFLISCNIGEIIAIFMATVFAPIIANGLGISANSMEILLPIHILWINLVTDSLPALTLAFDPANSDIMKRKPLKPSKGIFTKGMTYRIIYQGIMIGIITIFAFLIGIKSTGNINVGQTMAFTVLAISELVHVYNIRDNKKSIFKTSIFNNMKLLLANVISAFLMVVILIVPTLRNVFTISALSIDNILQVICLIFTPVVVVEILKLFKINTFKDE